MPHPSLLLSALCALAAAAAAARPGGPSPSHNFANYFASANRAGGTFSLVNPTTLERVDYTLPNAGEPMYFAGLFFPVTPRPVELWVGDRANSRLAITRLEGDKIVPDGFVNTPAGLFHSMTTQDFSARRPRVLTTCDIANVTVVHDIRSRKRLCKLRRPKIARRLGAKPHDVTIDKQFAFVTYLGASDGNGYVAAYRVRKCKLLRVLRTASDPHVALRPNTRLWIAAQGGEVLSVTVPRMKLLSNDTSQPSPHGMFISYDLKNVYITNIAEGGINAVVVYDQMTGRKKDCAQVDASFPVPHNPALSVDNKKLYITHSGATSDVNTAWDILEDGCVDPASEVVIRTGLNPFGAFVLPPPEQRS